MGLDVSRVQDEAAPDLVALLDTLHQPKAVVHRHNEIGKDDRSRSGLHHRQRLVSCSRRRHLMAPAREPAQQDFSNRLLVVHDQNVCHAGRGAYLQRRLSDIRQTLTKDDSVLACRTRNADGNGRMRAAASTADGFRGLDLVPHTIGSMVWA